MTMTFQKTYKISPLKSNSRGPVRRERASEEALVLPKFGDSEKRTERKLDNLLNSLFGLKILTIIITQPTNFLSEIHNLR